MTTENFKEAFTRAHRYVEEAIEVWHGSESENALHEYLCWSKEEYKAYVEDNVIPGRIIEQHLES